MIQCIRMGIVVLIMRIKYCLFVMLISVFSIFMLNYTCMAGTRTPVLSPLGIDGSKTLVEFIDKNFLTISEISKDKIVKELGVPNKIFQKKIANPYYDELDTRYTLVYPGLVLSFVELSSEAGGGVLFDSIIVSSNKWPFKPLAIGMTSQEILNVFPGNYRWLNNSTLQYSVGAYTPNTVLLYFAKNRLLKIEWKFYSG